MLYKSIIGAACTCLAVVSINANAVVVNTLNGVTYEWLELTETVNMSRVQVEAGIAAASPGSVLYGYEYASRALVEDLLLSYTSFDGIDGNHGAPNVVSGVTQFFNDFGALVNSPGNLVLVPYTTVDGYDVQYEAGAYKESYGLYGNQDECGDLAFTCRLQQKVFLNRDDESVMALQDINAGWDANYINPAFESSLDGGPNAGSLLVRASVVPIPAAVWLFASGLLGLIGIARRRSA